MACETLERMVYDNGFGQCRAVGTIDAYAMGAYAQYAGPVCEMGGLHDCGIDGWNSTDHGPRPVGAASAEDFDPYGCRRPAGLYDNTYGAFDEGAILGGWKNPVCDDRPLEGCTFRRGMEIEGGYRLYGTKSTAIIHDPTTGLDIHHHCRGGGAIYHGEDVIDIFPWKK